MPENPDKPEGLSCIALRENRLAREAVSLVADDLAGAGAPSPWGRPREGVRLINPLFLHGLPGTGKSLLVSILLEDVSRRAPTKVACVLPAGDLGEVLRSPTGEPGDSLEDL